MESNTLQVEIPSSVDEIVEVEIPSSVDEIDQTDSNTQDVAVLVEIYAVASSLQKKESTISSKDKCCIYVVPEYAKKGYEECYRPSVISIGPVFYDVQKLEPLQELKLILFKSFREHPNNAEKNLEPYIRSVRAKKDEILECYEKEIRLSSHEFIEMIVLDSAFLIYFMLALSESDHDLTRGTIFPNMNKLNVHDVLILEDSFLMENQLPFFILEDIYDMAFNNVSSRPSFVDLALEYIRIDAKNHQGTPRPEAVTRIIDNGINIIDAPNMKHLLHLRNLCCSRGACNNDNNHNISDVSEENNHNICVNDDPTPENVHKMDSAKQLSDAGVKFKSTISGNQFDIKFNDKNGELIIPKLFLYDGVDVLFRNMLIYEQLSESNYGIFDYISFFDDLINSVDDIQVLQQNGILENFFGSDQDAANLFNNLPKNLPCGGYGYYSSVEEKLMKYTSTPCNKWKAIFWSKYFNHPWAITSVIAAVILFILTLLQTITGFTCK